MRRISILRGGARLLLPLLLAVLLLTACGAGGKPAAYQTITAEEAKAMMDAGGVTVVDVRTQAEYDGGHIPGAVLVPVESIGSEPPAALPDTAATLLVYCRSGRRSAIAAEKLAGLGYTNVYDFGGINDWPYETEQ